MCAHRAEIPRWWSGYNTESQLQFTIAIFLILVTLSWLEARDYGGKSWHVSCQSPRVAKQTLTAICWTNGLKPCHPQKSKTCFWSVFKTNLTINCICPMMGKWWNIIYWNKTSFPTPLLPSSTSFFITDVTWVNKDHPHDWYVCLYDMTHTHELQGLIRTIAPLKIFVVHSGLQNLDLTPFIKPNKLTWSWLIFDLNH